MKLQTMFKGMLLSQGYVGTLRALRAIAPEALPDGAVTTPTAPGRGQDPAQPGENGRADADPIDIAGQMPWALAYARRSPPPPARTLAPPARARAADACCA